MSESQNSRQARSERKRIVPIRIAGGWLGSSRVATASLASRKMTNLLHVQEGGKKSAQLDPGMCPSLLRRPAWEWEGRERCKREQDSLLLDPLPTSPTQPLQTLQHPAQQSLPLPLLQFDPLLPLLRPLPLVTRQHLLRSHHHSSDPPGPFLRLPFAKRGGEGTARAGGSGIQIGRARRGRSTISTQKAGQKRQKFAWGGRGRGVEKVGSEIREEEDELRNEGEELDQRSYDASFLELDREGFESMS